MKIMQRITRAILPIALLIPCIATANVIRPALDIGFFNGDAGALLTGDATNGFVFDIDATAFAIVTADTANPIDITNQTFTLHATFNPNVDTAFSGTFNVAGGLLSGTFTNLIIGTLSSGSLDFASDLVYTSGSLMGSLSGGRIEGLGSDTNLSAKLGPVTVVPVPAAAWLFGSGLIGLVGIARRKTA